MSNSKPNDRLVYITNVGTEAIHIDQPPERVQLQDGWYARPSGTNWFELYRPGNNRVAQYHPHDGRIEITHMVPLHIWTQFLSRLEEFIRERPCRSPVEAIVGGYSSSQPKLPEYDGWQYRHAWEDS